MGEIADKLEIIPYLRYVVDRGSKDIHNIDLGFVTISENKRP